MDKCTSTTCAKYIDCKTYLSFGDIKRAERTGKPVSYSDLSNSCADYVKSSEKSGGKND